MHQPNYLLHFWSVKPSNEVDYIIVGQGLAGSSIALELLNHGRRIMVIDRGDKNQASRVAAGLFNPITGKNFVKTWKADEIFPCLHRFYAGAQQLMSQRFFFPMPLYRPFLSVREQNEWMGKSVEKDFREYVADVKASPYFPQQVNDPFGGLLLRQTGFLDTATYLTSIRDYLLSRQSFQLSIFNEDNLIIDDRGVAYEHYRAKRIIFCQGAAALSNKWFRNLPIRALKGEILTIKTQWKTHVILNRGVYMVPGSVSGEFRVGSTYKVNDHSPGNSEEGRAELEARLNELIVFPYEVVGQNWGTRPAAPDRRPILGHHAEFEQLVIFNGLGTKGVSLAPYFSGLLYRWLETRDPLPKEVDVTRYY